MAFTRVVTLRCKLAPAPSTCWSSSAAAAAAANLKRTNTPTRLNACLQDFFFFFLDLKELLRMLSFPLEVSMQHSSRPFFFLEIQSEFHQRVTSQCAAGEVPGCFRSTAAD